jgi:D-glycerate 3-kinase
VVDTWLALGQQLCAQLEYDSVAIELSLSSDAIPDALTAAQAARVYRYYLPVYLYVTARLDAHREAWRRRGTDTAAPPLTVGLSAPQGCGKTTLVTQLQRLMEATGVAAASVSIDDVYLTAGASTRPLLTSTCAVFVTVLNSPTHPTESA